MMQKFVFLVAAMLFALPTVMAEQSAKPYAPLNSERYDYASDFSEGLAAVNVNHQWGFIDASGKMVIAPQFNPYQTQFNSYFSEGLVAINLTVAKKPVEGNDPSGVRWGFADKSGKIVIKPQFEGNYYAPPHFANGLAAISGNFIGTTVATFGLNTKFGYIDKTGKFVIPQKFDEAYDFSDELASVRVGNKYGFIDKTGRMVIAPTFDAPGFFKDGIAIVEINNLSYIIDKANHKVLNQGFEGLSAFSEGLARFVTKGNIGFMDKSGKIKIQPKFSLGSPQSVRLMYFSEGLCPFETLTSDTHGRISKRVGYIDKNGKTSIEAQFDYAGPFKNGIAVVSLNGNYGYINKTGQFVIQPVFANAGYFSDGVARVSGGAGFGDYKYRFIQRQLK